jgi:hypothetical protein
VKLRPFPKKARSSWSGTLRDAPFSEGAALFGDGAGVSRADAEVSGEAVDEFTGGCTGAPA